ncbi:MAG TPA: amino acid adenylation domain-containing protein [Longimicrobium sp.]|nr:amino acid adenylation domain-containing protein [Longimicrobium sp.]
MAVGAGPWPLSFAQERLWFLDQFAPGTPVYNVPVSFRVTVPFSVPVLERTLAEIARRHAVLRTTFALRDGRPVQVVAPPAPVPVSVTDLRGEPAAEAHALALAAEEARRPFDLAAGPLWRARVLRIGENDHLLLVTLHHIVADGWSVGVLLREIGTIYAAFAAGRPSPLPELPLQFCEFAERQRRTMAGDALARPLAYWRERLAGAPGALALPADRPRPAVQSYRGGVVTFPIPERVTQALRALGRREGATLFMTLLAAFKTLLMRYTGQADVVVGAPVANRTRAEYEPLIGFFANTLALRTDLSGNPAFRALLRRVRDATLGAYAHQELPFERLVEELQPERALNRNPLFQVLFALQHASLLGEGGAGVAADLAAHPTGVAKFDLSLYVAENGAALAGAFEFGMDLFDAATIERMAAHFGELLAGIAADADRPVGSLPLLDAAERRRLLAEWGAGLDVARPAGTVARLFEAQARRTPDAVAVTGEGEPATYAELNRRANRLAHWLRARGVGPGVPVAVCLPRGPDLPMALMAVLKAGGAWVPLDPEYPPDRLAFMVRDVRAPVLVAHTTTLDRVEPGEARVICIDRDASLLGTQAEDDPAPSAGPGDPAYVIYTSGSTGRPKGVEMGHAALTNLVLWQEAQCPASSGGCCLQYMSLGFDVSVLEMAGPLAAGGRVAMLNERDRADFEGLAERIAREKVARLFLPASALHSLGEVLVRRPQLAASLRDVIATGEQLQVTDAVRQALGAAGAMLHNEYGPTETHFVTAAALPPHLAPRWPSLPPIGRPIHNAEVYVVDQALQPVPAGVAGELVAGGVTVAMGYVDRPGLTAARFVPNPFGTVPGGRMYRTGDLVRHAADGGLEYLGRMDRQVKIRGNRVEPGEVEAVLRSHPSVREAAVRAHPDARGQKQLIAYVVAAEGDAVSPGALRALAAARLPEHAVPARIRVMDALPLSPNGKIDRDALPPPGDERQAEHQAVPPRTPLERRVAAAWEEVLGMRGIGVTDSFFELGGHSLLATRLVARMRDAFRVEVPVRRLFETPTVADLACAVVELQATRADPARLESWLAELEGMDEDDARRRLDGVAPLEALA